LNSGGKIGYGIRRILKHLYQRYESIMMSELEDLGLSTVKVMGEYDVGALMKLGGLGPTRWRRVRKFLQQFLEHPISVSEKSYKTIGSMRSPTRCGVYFHENAGGLKEKMTFWVKRDVAGEVLRKICQCLNGHSVPLSKLERVDICLGGDHGKCAFRAPVKVNLTISGKKDPLISIFEVATIFCRKDTGLIIKNTVAPEINEGFGKLTTQKIVFGETKDGIVATLRGDNSVDDAPNEDSKVWSESTESLHACEESDEELLHDGSLDGGRLEDLAKGEADGDLLGNHTAKEDSTIHKRIFNPNIFLCGDILFFCMVIGKEGMASCWCYLCNLANSTWKSDPDAAFEMWTRASISAKHKENKKGALREGVSGVAIFPWIEPQNCVVPLLHCLIGILNDIIKYLLNIVYYKIEQISEEEVDNRRTLALLESNIDEAKAVEASFKDAENGEKELKSLRGKSRTAGKNIHKFEGKFLRLIVVCLFAVRAICEPN
jgi:hypothetical protein